MHEGSRARTCSTGSSSPPLPCNPAATIQSHFMSMTALPILSSCLVSASHHNLGLAHQCPELLINYTPENTKAVSQLAVAGDLSLLRNFQPNEVSVVSTETERKQRRYGCALLWRMLGLCCIPAHQSHTVMLDKGRGAAIFLTMLIALGIPASPQQLMFAHDVHHPRPRCHVNYRKP